MTDDGSELQHHRVFQRRTEPGAPPGSVISLPDALPPKMQVFSYGPGKLIERDITSPNELTELVGRLPVTWVNVDGLGHADTIQKMGEIFSLHPLALEDVVHVHQRSKVEDYAGQLFIVARMVRMRPPDAVKDDADAREKLETEQISMFLGKDFVLTFQEEGEEDCLEPLRERLRKDLGRARQSSPDNLAYAILDAVTDGYFPVIEWYSEELDRVEDALDHGPTVEQLRRIHRLRADLLTLRRSAWPLRDALQHLQRDTYPLITPETRVYLRDCFDHTVQIIDVLETYREICGDLREFYFSTLGQRTNEIMKVLTIISTIFIPLSFVAGVYGMNFNTEISKWNMPELNWRLGYPFSLAIMSAITAGLLYYFWRKGWFGR